MGFQSDSSFEASFFGQSRHVGATRNFTDYSLRGGYIVAVYGPNDENNISKKNVEYDVACRLTNKNGSTGEVVYPRCVVQSLFGGAADYSEWTLRLDKDGSGERGSNVLILCNNGNRREAYIVGGLNHFKRPKSADPADNSYYNWEFNGLKQSVNDAGDFTIYHKGKTNDDGTVWDKDLFDKNMQGFLSMTSDGKISVGYDKFGTDYASIELSKIDKTLYLYSNKNTYIESETGPVTVLTAEGLHINPGNVDNQAFMRGTIYRQQESSLHNELKTRLTQLAALLLSIGANVTASGGSLATAGVSLGIPGSGALLASPQVSVAGATLTAAGGSVTTAQSVVLHMLAQLQAFEAQASKYLSTHHNFGETP